MRRDVIVVGGGPAGAASAMLLAREGFDVEIFERREFPRAKPCGDCISPGANRILERLGVLPALLAHGPAQLQGWSLFCDGAHFGGNFADCTTDTLAQTGYAMSRDRLDSVLLDAARAAGATVTCAHVRDVAALDAKLIIGADGLRSRVARSLGAIRRAPRLRKHSFTAHVRGVPHLTSSGEMHVTEDACLGIAPVTPGADPVCNITVVLSAPSAGGKHAAMRAGLRKFHDRNLADLITDDVEVLTSGPFDWPTRRIAFENAILVGDAAGYYDPFTGQGIFQALAAAEIAAEHAVSFLQSGSSKALQTYETRQRKLLRSARRLQHVIEMVCSRPRAARMAFRALDAAPYVSARLLRATSDLT